MELPPGEPEQTQPLQQATVLGTAGARVKTLYAESERIRGKPFKKGRIARVNRELVGLTGGIPELETEPYGAYTQFRVFEPWRPGIGAMHLVRGWVSPEFSRYVDDSAKEYGTEPGKLLMATVETFRRAQFEVIEYSKAQGGYTYDRMPVTVIAPCGECHPTARLLSYAFKLPEDARLAATLNRENAESIMTATSPRHQAFLRLSGLAEKMSVLRSLRDDTMGVWAGMLESEPTSKEHELAQEHLAHKIIALDDAAGSALTLGSHDGLDPTSLITDGMTMHPIIVLNERVAAEAIECVKQGLVNPELVDFVLNVAAHETGHFTGLINLPGYMQVRESQGYGERLTELMSAGPDLEAASGVSDRAEDLKRLMRDRRDFIIEPLALLKS